MNMNSSLSTAQERGFLLRNKMRFKTYLTEAAVGKDLKFNAIDVEKAISLLNTHCKDALWMLEMDKAIWRGHSDGLPSEEPFYTFDPSKTRRKSQNTSNYYTVIFDNIPSMENFPKRSESLIASTDFRKANDYGSRLSTFVVIPYDGVKIGCVHKSDMWDTHIKFKYLDDTVRRLNANYVELGIRESWKSFLNYQEKLDSGNSNSINRFHSLFGKREDPTQFLEIIKQAYSPKITKFTVETTKTLQKYADEKQEVWIGGPCIAITAPMWRELRKSMNE